MLENFLRVRIYSDLHVEFAAQTKLDFEGAVDDDLVILAGDIHTKKRGVTWAQDAFSVPVVYICGNHEFYKGHIDRTLQSMKKLAAGTNVHVLENESMTIGDLRILGACAWTDFSSKGSVYQSSLEARSVMNDFRLIRAGDEYRRLRIDDVIRRNRQTYDYLSQELARDFDGKTLVVTHHCPLVEFSGPEKDSELMPAYSNEWPELVGQADYWVFGHTHHRVDAMVAGCRLISNPRGYPNEKCGFDQEFVLEII